MIINKHVHGIFRRGAAHYPNFTILLVFLIASCTQASVATSPPVTKMVGVSEVAVTSSDLYTHTNKAPNQKWGLYVDKMDINIVNTGDHLVIAKLPIDPGWGCLVGDPYWSPDSQRFIMGGYEGCFTKAAVARVVVYKLDPATNKIETAVIEGPPLQRGGWLTPFVAWSPDGEKVAVSVDWVNITVLDREIRVVDRFHVEKSAVQWADGVGWIYDKERL